MERRSWLMKGPSPFVLVALELAASQHGVVSRQQLLARGIPPRAVADAVLGSVLFPVFTGVYVVGRPHLTRDGLFMASLLAAGDGAVLGSRTAASIWGFLYYKGPVEVLRKQGGGNRPARLRVEGMGGKPFLIVRRPRNLLPGDVTVRRGFPLTTPERTLLEISSALPDQEFQWAFMEADRLQLLDDRALTGCASRSQGRKGAGRLRNMARKRVPNIGQARSLLEAIVLDLHRIGLIPAPEINQKTHAYRPDFRWSEQGVLVEADGYEFHRGREAFENDVLRANRLRAEGWTVLRFTWRMVTERPQEVAAMIRKTLDLGSRNMK